MRKKERQSGFGTTVILLAVLVVAVLAVSGLFLFQHHKSSTKDSAATSQNQTSTHPKSTTTTQTQPATSTTTQVQIPELSITLIVPNSIKDVQYKAVSNVSSPDVASVDFTTASLSNAEPTCSSSGGGIALALGRLAKTSGQYPSDPSTAGGKLVRQFPSYYISYVAPQASCAVNNPNAEKLVESQRAALQSALTSSSVQAM